MKPHACPCGNKDYAACCGRYHAGKAAPDAQSLMRSRYSAYALMREDYLLATWHPDTRPATLDLAADSTKWLGLKILAHTVESPDDATVEFIARYRIAGRGYRLHEISRFVRIDGRWLYLNGEFPK